MLNLFQKRAQNQTTVTPSISLNLVSFGESFEANRLTNDLSLGIAMIKFASQYSWIEDFSSGDSIYYLLTNNSTFKIEYFVELVDENHIEVKGSYILSKHSLDSQSWEVVAHFNANSTISEVETFFREPELLGCFIN